MEQMDAKSTYSITEQTDNMQVNVNVEMSAIEKRRNVVLPSLRDLTLEVLPTGAC